MKRIFKNTESDELITESQLKADFETLQREQPEEYNYTFYQYILNCTGKNGFLEEIK